MSSVRDRVIAYLGQGIPPSQVAASVGVTPAWVSQLMDEPGVQEQVALLRATRLDDAIQHDEKLDRIKNKVIDIIDQKLPFVRTAKEAAGVLGVLSRVDRRTPQQTAETDAASAQQVVISLPKAAAIKITVDSRNQVVEIDGETMAPLPSRNLKALAETIRPKAVTDVNVPQLTVTQPKVLDTVRDVREKLIEADKKRAATVLDNLKSQPLFTTINGRVCEL